MFDPPILSRHDARICVVGGGGSGAALAYDLALRGFSVLLLEKGEFTSGTTGRHHGQLHSGARYAVGDREIARECMEETLVLRRIVPQAIEYNGGIFAAIRDDEADYAPAFVSACLEAGIPAREIPAAEARAREPALNPALKRSVWVPDGTIDAYRLAASFLSAAAALGAEMRAFTELVGVETSGGRIQGGTIRDPCGREERVSFDCLVSAAGAWAGEVGALAGLDIPITPAPGTMVAVRGRISDMVLSRLAPPGDGDILVPQRGLSIIGSTQTRADSPEGILPTKAEIEFLFRRADELVPGFSAAPFHAAWAAARPLAGRAASDAEGRAISRDFAVLDHGTEGVSGMFTLIGGKATVLRAMARKAADAVCAHLGIREPCRTADFPLPSWRSLDAFQARMAGRGTAGSGGRTGGTA